MNILLAIHSHTRWLVILAAILLVIKFLIGWLGKQEFKKLDRILAAMFTGFVDLQVSLGLILIIWMGVSGLGFPRYRIEHAFTMIVAAVVAHLATRWKKAEDSIKFRNTLFCVLASLALIFVGVLQLPGGWSR